MEKDPTPAELLAQSIDGMPPSDRTRVLVWLLNRSFAHDPMALTRHALAANLSLASPPDTPSLLSRTLLRRGEHQVVPIRLPTDQHTALRDWCQEHGFTMATVVRGLVERFLEERGLLHREPDPPDAKA